MFYILTSFVRFFFEWRQIYYHNLNTYIIGDWLTVTLVSLLFLTAATFCFSYALYKMFDDLILLGKGGLTVYHGSVKKVEEYFLGLGINFPERINPPDYFIDILEGIITPGGSSGLSYKDLPVRWMLHNGYPIPLDMRQNAVQYDMSQSVNSANEIDPCGSSHAEKTFAGELWQDMRNNVELRGEKIRHNFFKSKDLSDRKTPGVLKQYKYFLIR